MATHRLNISSRAARSRGRAQRGFSLWELAVLVGLLGLGIGAGFVFLKAQEVNQRETERTTLLAAADRAVLNFIAIQGRLPCPDSTGSGAENCAAGIQKGWLPAVTLGLDASAPARGVMRVRYIAYRGAGTKDLAVATDRFSPAKWDYYASPSVASFFGPYSPPQTSVVDFCRGLTLANGDPANAATAHTSGPLNVAYALADGGIDRDGNGTPFDGALNPAATPGLESPARAADAAYDDRVLAHGFTELANLLNCTTATRSLDAMGQAVEVGNEVKSQAESTRLMAIILSAVNGVKALIQTAKLLLSGVALATAIGVLAAAVGALAGAIGTCIVLVGCALIPGYAAAVASAALGVTLATSAVALNAAAVAYHVTATVQTSIVAQKASAAVDTGTVDLTTLVTQVQQAAADAVTTAAASSAAATAARSAANTALTVYDTQVANLVAYAHSINPGYAWRGVPDPNPIPYPGWTRPVDVDPGDAKLTAVISSARAYGDANVAFVTADGAYLRDLKRYNDAFGSNTAAALDAQNNPTDQTKQDVYAQTLTPEALAYVANLLTIRDQSNANRTTKLGLRDAAQATFSAAAVAVNQAYPSPLYFDDVYVFNLLVLRSWVGHMTNAYNDYLSKNIAATEKERVAVLDAQNATDAANAVTALNAAIAAQQANSAAGAIVVQGGDAILQEADLRGSLK